MSTYGVIFCCYNTAPKDIDRCLAGWENVSAKIIAVSNPFENFEPVDNTDTWLHLAAHRRLEGVQESGVPLPECNVRNMALFEFQTQDGPPPDYIWLLDSDEFYTEKEIENIMAFVEGEEFIPWFKIHLKNYIFDGKQWVDGFCPPRIFKTHCPPYGNLCSFYWDNDVKYAGNREFDYREIPSMEIPRNVAHIRHETWMNNERGRQKVAYQKKHFGHCSYRWNKKDKALEFDLNYYDKTGEKLPIIHHD